MTFNGMTYDEYLVHRGVSIKDGAPGRGSGRYPLGSGENPYQHAYDLRSRIKQLRDQGYSDLEIAGFFELKTATDLRRYESILKNELRAEQYFKIQELQNQGYNNSEIARMLGLPSESSVRSIMDPKAAARMFESQRIADMLKNFVDQNGMLDVGSGLEADLGISSEKLDEALLRLNLEYGYNVFRGGVAQVTNKGKETIQKVLCPPGAEWKDIYNFDEIHTYVDYEKKAKEEGKSIRPQFTYPESLDSKRLAVRYSEDGGDLKDGVIEVRRGKKDISLGNDHYAQVRIMVDGTHYLKGMAMYSDDLPDGVDVLFNTNKHRGTPILGDDKNNTVLKKIKDDPSNPFGSLIKPADKGGQSFYDDPKGKYVDPVTGKKQSLSLINKTKNEGDWEQWTKKLPAQFLAKQGLDLIKKQLNLTIAEKKADLEEINKLTNPSVKKRLLDAFAEDCDKNAVHLKASALPGQRYQVILPLKTIKDDEVYAPNYKNGTKIALVRFPHEGIFQIPILKVNNKNKEGDATITKNAQDAVGISKKNADILSGADFDGDTVMCIPITGKTKITNRSPLKDLEGFDTKEAYGPQTNPFPYKRMTNTQTQMGIISNLIMDMTIKGATPSELARAAKMSMVTIDAEKHGLDYKRCEKDNDIASLKRTYQGHEENGSYREGVSTLLTRAKSQTSVPKRQGNPKIDPETGKLVYKTSNDLYYQEKKKVKEKDPVTGRILKDENGKTIYKKDENGKTIWVETGKTKMRTQKSTKMAETDDAMTLVSKEQRPQELLYANFANQLKALANTARKEEVATKAIPYSASAKTAYQKEVDSLNAKLMLAQSNRQPERAAQRAANARVQARKKDNPSMSKSDIKKAEQQELEWARERYGAKRHPIDIDDREWEAIQAGAVRKSTLDSILNYTNIDVVRQRATPRNTSNKLSNSQINTIKAMMASGYTNAEIAQRFGISETTVMKYGKGE